MAVHYVLTLHPGLGGAYIRELPSETISQVEGLTVGPTVFLKSSLRQELENINFRLHLPSGEKREFKDFPTHLRNALYRADIYNFEQLDLLSETQLLTIRSIGAKSVSLIMAERSARKKTG